MEERRSAELGSTHRRLERLRREHEHIIAPLNEALAPSASVHHVKARAASSRGRGVGIIRVRKE